MKSFNQFLESKALWELSEISIGYKTTGEIIHNPHIKNSEDAYKILRHIWSPDIELLEEFNALFLNRANRVKGIFRVSKGGITGTVIDPRILFGAALKTLTTSIILAHNHPSGNLIPSTADISITKSLFQGGKILQIEIHDHLILSPFGEYYSMKDNHNF